MDGPDVRAAHEVPGCVVPQSSGAGQLQLENHLALPFLVQLPPGTSPRTNWLGFTGLPDFLAHFYAAGLGGSYVGPHHAGQVDVTSGVMGATGWHAGLHR